MGRDWCVDLISSFSRQITQGRGGEVVIGTSYRKAAGAGPRPAHIHNSTHEHESTASASLSGRSSQLQAARWHCHLELSSSARVQAKDGRNQDALSSLPPVHPDIERMDLHACSVSLHADLERSSFFQNAVLRAETLFTSYGSRMQQKP